MIFRDPGCRDCRDVTSGDCGQHGPRFVELRLQPTVVEVLPTVVEAVLTAAANLADQIEDRNNRDGGGFFSGEVALLEAVDAWRRQSVRGQ